MHLQNTYQMLYYRMYIKGFYSENNHDEILEYIYIYTKILLPDLQMAMSLTKKALVYGIMASFQCLNILEMMPS